MALLHTRVTHQTAIRFWFVPPRESVDPRPRWIRSTVGRVLFNNILPRKVVAELGFRDDLMRKKALSELVLQSYRRAGLRETVEFLDRLKRFGFDFATLGGISIGVEDLEIPPEKQQLLDEAQKRVERFQRAYNTGQITFGERYNKVIDAWTHANNDVAEAMISSMRTSRGGFNPVYMMFDSGSRGSRDQIRQLAGMRGLMAKPQKKLTGGIGEIIESPIKSNFREGLSVLEYFISTHGARKGLADTALKTADAGYLTRRLVDVAQDVTITEEDCGTVKGLEMSALKEGEDVIESLKERIIGTVAAEDVFDPHELDEHGDPEAAGAGRPADRRRDRRRHRRGRHREGAHPLGAHLRIAARCLPACATAATSPPWSWSTWAKRWASWPRSRSASRARSSPCGPSTSVVPRHVSPKKPSAAPGPTASVRYSEGLDWTDLPVEYEDGTKGNVRVVTSREDESATEETKQAIEVCDPKDPSRVLNRYPVPAGAILHVKEGDPVTKGDGERRATILYTWDPYNDPSIIKIEGELRWKDLVPGVTLKEELDEGTGLRSLVVTADPDRELHPSVLVYANKKDPQEYTLAEGSRIILGSPADQVSRAMDVPDEANPWSSKFHVEERPVAEAWPGKSKKETKDKTVYLSPTGARGQGCHHHQDAAAGVQDPRHHGRPAPRGRAVRGAAAQGSGHDVRGGRHRQVRRDQARQARDLRVSDR